MDPVSLLFSFRGRTGRRPYWLGLIVALVVLMLAAGALASAMNPRGGGAAPLLALPLIILFLWIHAAVIVKRLRDAGKSLWLYLLFGPGLMAWLAGTAEAIEQAWFVALVGAAVLIALPGLMPSEPEEPTAPSNTPASEGSTP